MTDSVCQICQILWLYWELDIPIICFPEVLKLYFAFCFKYIFKIYLVSSKFRTDNTLYLENTMMLVTTPVCFPWKPGITVNHSQIL